MKAFTTVLKILAALAAIAAAVYVAITYGDKIVAWVKKVLKLDQTAEICCCDGDCAEGCCDCECPEDLPAEEGAVEAEDKDFEGQ